MIDGFFLALRYLRAAPWRTAVLVLGLSMALFLPLFTFRAASWIEQTLLQRADATPLIVGAKGNEFDLTMSSLYFRGQSNDTISYRERQRIETTGDNLAVPLLVRYSIGGTPLVGTSPEYFEQRELLFAEGRRPALLGEVGAGAEVAKEYNLSIGDTVRSDLTNLYNLAGSYPIMLEVVGILASSGSTDDQVFFSDIKTTWMIDGRLHGHEAVTRDSLAARLGGGDGAQRNGEAGNVQGGAQGDVDGDNVEASAAIFLFTAIDETNRDTFHLHGDDGDAPMSSLLVFPSSARSRDQILGDFALNDRLQAVQPRLVVEAVLDIVLRLRAVLVRYFFVVLLSTLSFFALVLAMTVRLRGPDLELMERIGSARFTLARILLVEIMVIVLCAGLVSLLLSSVGLILLERSLLP